MSRDAGEVVVHDVSGVDGNAEIQPDAEGVTYNGFCNSIIEITLALSCGSCGMFILALRLMAPPFCKHGVVVDAAYDTGQLTLDHLRSSETSVSFNVARVGSAKDQEVFVDVK